MPRWTKEENKLFIEIYNQTKNNYQLILAAFPQKSPQCVTSKIANMRKAGLVEILPKNTTNYIKSGKLKRLLDNDLETFYWVGFLLADGTMNDVELGLELKGNNHLIKFINYLDSFYDIKIKNRHQNNNKRNNCALTVRDQETLPLLKEKFDIKNRKTYNPPNFSLYYKFTDDQIFSLICGFIDGDGNIRKARGKGWQITLENHASWKTFHQFYEKFLFSYFDAKMNKDTYVRTNCRDYSLITLCQKSLIVQMKKKAIELGLPIMDRKWDIIEIN